MNKCLDCLHHQVCRILDGCKTYAKTNQIGLSIHACEHFKINTQCYLNKKSSVGVSSILETVGLGDQTLVNLSEAKHMIKNGRLCIICEQVRSEQSFKGDICSECGQEICEECAIYVDGQIICEKCF